MVEKLRVGDVLADPGEVILEISGDDADANVLFTTDAPAVWFVDYGVPFTVTRQTPRHSLAGKKDIGKRRQPPALGHLGRGFRCASSDAINLLSLARVAEPRTATRGHPWMKEGLAGTRERGSVALWATLGGSFARWLSECRHDQAGTRAHRDGLGLTASGKRTVAVDQQTDLKGA